MKARIWLICWLTSPFESEISKEVTSPFSIRPSTSRRSSLVTDTRHGLPWYDSEWHHFQGLAGGVKSS